MYQLAGKVKSKTCPNSFGKGQSPEYHIEHVALKVAVRHQNGDAIEQLVKTI